MLKEHEFTLEQLNEIVSKDDEEDEDGEMVKSRLLPIALMKEIDKKNKNFSMKLCKFHMNGV